MFAPTSFWTQPLPADAPIDPDSNTYVENLIAQGEETAFGINYRDWGKTIFYANAGDPVTPVTVDQPDTTFWKELESELAEVRIPSRARPPGPWPIADNHMVVIVCHPDRTFDLYEFWRARRFEIDGKAPETQEPVEAAKLERKGWHCQAAFVAKGAHLNPGYTTSPNHYSAAASGLSLLGGAITVAEAQRSYIPHALSFTAIHSKIAAPVAKGGMGPRWPAVKTDGSCTDEDAVQEGMIFTVPSSLDVTTLFGDEFSIACARAIRDHGMVIDDGSNTTVALNAEATYTVPNSEAEQRDAWKGPEDKFGGHNAIFPRFVGGEGGLIEELFTGLRPHLQVVDASYRPTETVAGSVLSGLA